MRIKATLHYMAESEIKAMIPIEKMKEIKARCPHPVFKAFVIGHEGEAKGRLIGVGSIIKQWFADAIRKLNEKLKIGLQLFHGHAETNTAEGRVPIGEVVAKKLMEIKDRLSSVMVGWIYPGFSHLPLDVASIEANLDLRGESESFYVADVDEISGIALGNSQVEMPGFPGATLLGQLQAFAEKKNKITLFKGGENMTLEELKNAIQEAKFKPTDLFDREVILADPFISEQVKEKISNARGYDIRKFETLTEQRVKLEKDLEKAQAKITEQETAIGNLKLESAKSTIPELFEKQKKERSLDERQVKWLEIGLKKFKPEKADETEKELNVYLDSKIDEYNEMFGIEEKKPKSGGSEPVEPKKGDVDEKDKYTDPKQNPMIPRFD